MYRHVGDPKKVKRRDKDVVTTYEYLNMTNQIKKIQTKLDIIY
jgi:hypothetical protein